MPTAAEKPKAKKTVAEKTALTNAAVRPVQGTVSPASNSFFRQKKVWIVGLVLLAVIFGFLWLLAHRSQGDSRISLITRSLDQDDLKEISI